MAQLSAKQRSVILSFDDIAIFVRAMEDVKSLLLSGSGGDRQKRGEGLPWLLALEFETMCGAKRVMRISEDVLQDVDAFWALLERFCPKPFSGRLRRRRNRVEWPELLAQPARDAKRLQQRVAQLVEQRLWELADETELADD